MYGHEQPMLIYNYNLTIRFIKNLFAYMKFKSLKPSYWELYFAFDFSSGIAISILLLLKNEPWKIHSNLGLPFTSLEVSYHWEIWPIFYSETIKVYSGVVMRIVIK